MNKLIKRVAAVGLLLVCSCGQLSAAEANFTVATFNVEWLGYPQNSGSWRSSRSSQIRQAAKEISQINADIVAMQEVVIDSVNGDALKDLLVELKAIDPDSFWAGTYNPRFSYWWNPDFYDYPAQRQAYIWKSQRVEFISAEPMLDWIGEGDSRFGSGRLPFLLKVKVKVGDFSRQLSLVNLHLKCCRGSADRRETSMLTLLEDLYANHASEGLIVLGDFNVADEGGAYGEISDWGFYADDDANGEQDFYHAAGETADLSYSDIDHVMISDELLDAWTAVEINKRNGIGYSSFSDHRPVYTRFVLTVEPDELYKQWQSNYAAQDARFAEHPNDVDDPDEDEIANYLEFRLGTSPVKRNSSKEVLAFSATEDNKAQLSFFSRIGGENSATDLYTRAADDLEWKHISEADMINFEKVVEDGSEGFDKITYIFDQLNEAQLFRLQLHIPNN